MTLREELTLGLALWTFGVAVMAGVALATPRFYTEGLTMGGLFGVLGLYLVWCSCTDLFADDWDTDIKQE